MSAERDNRPKRIATRTRVNSAPVSLLDCKREGALCSIRATSGLGGIISCWAFRSFNKVDMNDQENLNPPATLKQIQQESESLGFRMSSDLLTGSLLRTLAATKPACQFLELGTGTGIATAWLLDGMDQDSQLVTVDNDDSVVSVAREYLGHDRRVAFYVEDSGLLLERFRNQQFDLIFADTWPGKYSHLEQALESLKVGGLYVIDDMLPQPNWPEGHASKASQLISVLESRGNLMVTKMNWSTGVIVAARLKE